MFITTHNNNIMQITTVTDITDGKPRTIAITLFEQFWSIGVILLPGLASFFSTWTHLYMAISYPTIILVFLWRWIPDSPRWLLLHNRIPEAREILLESAEMNQRKHLIPNDFDKLLQIQSEAVRSDPPPAGWWTIWKGRRAVRHMICVHLSWSIYIVVYYGMLLNIRAFSREHLEVNTIIAGITQNHQHNSSLLDNIFNHSVCLFYRCLWNHRSIRGSYVNFVHNQKVAVDGNIQCGGRFDCLLSLAYPTRTRK